VSLLGYARQTFGDDRLRGKPIGGQGSVVADLPAPFLEEGEQLDRPAPGDESRIETVKE
jgi:hypothetical protein